MHSALMNSKQWKGGRKGRLWPGSGAMLVAATQQASYPHSQTYLWQLYRRYRSEKTLQGRKELFPCKRKVSLPRDLQSLKQPHMIQSTLHWHGCFTALNSILYRTRSPLLSSDKFNILFCTTPWVQTSFLIFLIMYTFTMNGIHLTSTLYRTP